MAEKLTSTFKNTSDLEHLTDDPNINTNQVSESVSETSSLLSHQHSRRTLIMTLKSYLSQISIPVYVCVVLFAIASWIDINGVWVELPLLVNQLPEGWNLPSYLAVIIQIANIGPILYTIVHQIAPNRVKEWPIVYVIIFIGAVACLLLALFWDQTTVLGQQHHSTALLILAGWLSLVDCTSSVVFLPYMALLKPQYLTAFYIGEGFSGLVPGIVGLIQGVGSDPTCVNETITIANKTIGVNYTEFRIVPVYPPPRFSVETFFYFLFAIICLSGISFTYVHFSARGKRERIPTTETLTIDGNKSVGNSSDTYENTDAGATQNQNMHESSVAFLSAVNDEGDAISSQTISDNINVASKQTLTKTQLVLILAAVGWINAFTNGILPSTQSYSCLPYGNLAYNLAIRLSTVANPLACFIALFTKTSSLVGVYVMTVVGTALSGYQLYLAASSPTPPLQDQLMGEFLVLSVV